MKYQLIVTVIIIAVLVAIVLANILVFENIVALTILDFIIIGVSSILIAHFTIKNIKRKFSKTVFDISNIHMSISVPIVIMDSSNKIIRANSAFLKLSKYKNEELINKQLIDIYIRPNIILKDGSLIPVKAQIWPMSLGISGDYSILIAQDGIPDENIGLEKSLECYGIGAISCDTSGIISNAYGGLIDILDLSRVYKDNKELVGKNIFDLAKFPDLDLKFVDKYNVTTLDTDVVTLLGTQRNYSICIVELNENKIYMTLRDITRYKSQEKIAKANMNRYKTIVSIAPIGIMVVDEDLAIKELNGYLSSIIGSKDSEKFIEKNISKISGLAETGIISSVKRVIKTREPITDNVQFLSQYGKTSSFTYIVTPIADGDKNSGALILIEDEGRDK